MKVNKALNDVSVNLNNRKNQVKSLFPKIGGMAISSYTETSPYSSMSKNRNALDNTLRDKVWTGNEVNQKPLELDSQFKESDYSMRNIGSKGSININDKMITLNPNSGSNNSSQFNKSVSIYDKFRTSQMKNSLAVTTSPINKKHSESLHPTTTRHNKKISLKHSLRKHESINIKDSHNTSVTNRQQKPYFHSDLKKSKINSITLRNHSVSIDTSKQKLLNKGIKSSDIRTYNQVNNSVEKHLQKYEYLIPDLRQK